MIRLMTVDDLNQIVALEEKYQIHPWPRVAFEQALRIGHYCPVYVNDEGVITAYGVADKGHGRTICAESIEGADAIYEAWFANAAACGASRCYAEIEADNRAARKRLRRFGFQIEGEIAHFYGVGHAAQVWAKTAGGVEYTDTQQNETGQGFAPAQEST